MEIPGNTALGSLKRNLENSIERILSRHENINDNIEINSEEFENIVCTITNSEEIQRITKKFLEYNKFYGTGKPNFINHLDKQDYYDGSKLDNICHQLLLTKNLDNKIKALELLLQYSVLDLMDIWSKLSKGLRESLINRNMVVFSCSLRVHIKLSAHPEAIIEATTNLLQGLLVIFHSRRISTHVLNIDFKSAAQEQIMRITNLFLNNLKLLFKNYNTHKERRPECLIPQFLELLICHKDYDRTDYIHMFYYIFILDPNAKWFQQLMHYMPSRKIVISFCYKNHEFLKYIIKEFIINLKSENFNEVRRTFTNEIPLEIIKYAAFQHCCNIISMLLSYKWGQRLFPVEIKSNETNLLSLIMIIMAGIQNLSNNPKQNYKREMLIDLIQSILIKNRHFLYNKDIVHNLIKPFLFKINEKHKLAEIVRKNKYVLNIINAVCNKQDAFFIIFGFAEANVKGHVRKTHQYIRSISLQEPLVMSSFIDKFNKPHHCSATERDNISIGKAICDFASNIVRYTVNTCEKVAQVDDIIFELLECCCNIHSLHTHVMIIINSRKLLQSCLNLYKVLIDNDLIINSMNSLLKFFIIICETRYGTDIFLKEDTELLYIVCKHYFYIFDSALNNYKHFAMFFANLANTIPGVIAITECKKQIISPYLNKIWKIEEDQILFLTGSYKLLEEESFKYYKFIFTLHLNFNCVQALLSNDNDDESTIVDSDNKPTNLKELIDDAMSKSGPGTCACFVGLQTVRILINNLDVLIFLESIADLKEQVSILQMECASTVNVQKSENSETSIIIDECSLLRKSIINYIHNLGLVQSGNLRTKSQQRLQSTTVSARNRRLHEFQRFLNDTRNNLHDNTWLLLARKLFKQTCQLNFKESTFADLVQQVRLTVPNNKSHFVWPDVESKFEDLFQEDYIGINIIVQFGKSNKLLQLPNQYEELLAILIKQVNAFLGLTRDKFEGFDWFIGVIFLMCGGNIDRSKVVLQCMVQLPIGPYIWPALAVQLGVIRSFDYSINFDHTLNRLIGDLEIFIPALEEAGISWNYIVRNWINQCFFNVLPWSELCNYLLLIILYPAEYILYFVVCCAQHLERRFLDAITNMDINHYQNILQLTGFHVSDYFNSLEQLAKQYKNILYK